MTTNNYGGNKSSDDDGWGSGSAGVADKVTSVFLIYFNQFNGNTI